MSRAAVVVAARSASSGDSPASLRNRTSVAMLVTAVSEYEVSAPAAIGTSSSAARRTTACSTGNIARPRSWRHGSSLSSATRYVVAMLFHGGDGESTGHIRPVYDLAYWQSTAGTDMGWIHDFRLGGGAGEWVGNGDSYDTD